MSTIDIRATAKRVRMRDMHWSKVNTTETKASLQNKGSHVQTPSKTKTSLSQGYSSFAHKGWAAHNIMYNEPPPKPLRAKLDYIYIYYRYTHRFMMACIYCIYNNTFTQTTSRQVLFRSAWACGSIERILLFFSLQVPNDDHIEGDSSGSPWVYIQNLGNQRLLQGSQ